VFPNDARSEKTRKNTRAVFWILIRIYKTSFVSWIEKWSGLFLADEIHPFLSFPARRPSRWDDSRTAPLATPETLSEASTSSPPSPVVPVPRPMRRTPKIPGNLSTAADDLKNNLHYAMLSAKNYFLRTGEHAGGSNNGSSSGNSEASYESAKSLAAAGLPPPVPRRRDSVIVRRWISFYY